MGDPRKARKQYDTPRHPWEKARIEEEKVLIREFGLKNKREIQKYRTMVKRSIDYYKTLNYQTSEQATKEKELLFARLTRLGFLKKSAELSQVLDLQVTDALSRRLQTLVFKKGFARSVKQARQFITHRHVLIDGKVVDAPGYIVSVEEENAISFRVKSPLFREDHPERKMAEVEEKPESKAAKAKEASEVAPVVEATTEAPVEVVAEEEVKNE